MKEWLRHTKLIPYEWKVLNKKLRNEAAQMSKKELMIAFDLFLYDLQMKGLNKKYEK